MRRRITVWYVILGLAIAVGTYAQGNKEDGLLGYWKFDEGKGDLAKDSSGQGNDGELYNAEWVKGKFGVALRFAGEDSYVSMPEIRDLDGSDELTVQAWVSGKAQDATRTSSPAASGTPGGS